MSEFLYRKVKEFDLTDPAHKDVLDVILLKEVTGLKREGLKLLLGLDDKLQPNGYTYTQREIAKILKTNPIEIALMEHELVTHLERHGIPKKP